MGPSGFGLPAPYVLVNGEDTLEKLLSDLKGANVLYIATRLSCNSDTGGILKSVQLTARGKPVFILDLETLSLGGLEALAWLLGGDAEKVMQDCKATLKLLTRAGVTINGPLFDLTLADRLLTAGDDSVKQHCLATLASRHLDLELPEPARPMRATTPPTAAQHSECANDTALLIPLRRILSKQLNKNGLAEVARIEFGAVRAFASMELAGLRVDLARVASLKEQLEAEAAVSLRTLREHFGARFNPAVDSEVRRHLAEIGINGTDKHAIAAHAKTHPAAKALAEYRSAAAGLSSFATRWLRFADPKTGRVHPSYVQLGTEYGRASSKSPSVHQVPGEPAYRRCVVADEGMLLVIGDYGQLDLRVAAELSRDRRMRRELGGGRDIHAATAACLLNIPPGEVTAADRKLAKAFNFGLLFGMGAEGLRAYALTNYGLELDLEQAARFRRRFFARYYGFSAWMKRRRRSGESEIRTLSGRRRLWGSTAPTAMQLVNTPIAGTAADIVKRALMLLPGALNGTGAEIVAMIHDEVILESPVASAAEVANILKLTMEEAGEDFLKLVPVVANVTVCADWSGKR